MFTRSAILFLYVTSIVILVAAGTCCILAGRKNKSKLNKSMIFLMVGLFVMCIYDMGIYYWNYVIGHFSSMEVMRIGNCLIALNIYLWISVQENIIKRESLRLMNRMVKNYILFYAGLWLILTFATSVDFFYTMKWLLLATDIILIVGALAVSIGHIIFAAVEGEKLNLYTMTIVTAMLLWNYISYFWGETSVYWGNSKFIREPLDMTIIFWIVINAALLVFAYKTLFVPAFLNDDKQVMSFERSSRLEDRLDVVCDTYGLTRRECELVELIYLGKSNKEIADQLFLSESTVKTHIYNIFRKMEVKNRVEVTCIVNGETVSGKPDESGE